MELQSDGKKLGLVLNEICDLGPRWQGSRGEKKIMGYLENSLQNLAVNYSKEAFDYLGFEPGVATLTIRGEPEVKIQGHTIGYSGSGQIEGGLVYASESSLGEADLANQIVITDALKSYEAYPKACKAGAKGFILGNTLPGNIVRVGVTNYQREVGTIPAITVGHDDMQYLLKLAGTDKKVSFKVGAAVEEKVGYNLIVETGQQEGRPKILVCSHYDSMWLGQHAFDNASGTAAMLELIRIFGNLPQFNLQFLFCGAEELGFWGSMAYVDRHLEQCKSIDCVVCLDAISSDLGAVELGVTKDLAPYIKELAEQTNFQVERWSIPPRPNSDHIAFAFLNTPVVWLTSMDPYYHSMLDTVSNVSEAKLSANTDFALRIISGLTKHL